MRKNKIVAVMLLVFVLALSFVLTACVTDEHQCTSKCPECGKCLNKECTQEACKEKCPGHEEKPEHVCGHKCPTCGKCTDTTCTDPVCADKCPGHEPTPPAHECTSKCPVCGKCTNKDCTEEACKEKCPGHGGDDKHVCQHVCPICEGCMDLTCTDPVCEIKCDCVVSDARALANALTFVKTQYQEVTTTTKDYTLPAVQPINGYEADRVTAKKYDVAITWTLTKISGLDVVTLTLDEAKNLYNVTVTYGPETNAQETTYKISATFTIGTETATWSMERTVPAFVFTTYAEYLTGCEKQSKDLMNVKAYVIGAIQSGSSIGSLYVQDAQGNGYYVYKPDFEGKDEAGTLDRDKVNELFPVGTEVIVSGVGKVYNGQYEFTSNDNSKTWPTVTKTGLTAETAGVTLGYKDGTADWSAAKDNTDETLIKYQNSLVELKLVTMTSVDGSYYYFTIGENKVQFNVYSNVYFITDAENKTLFEKFAVGNTATVKGIVSVFSKKYQIYPVSVEAISNVQEPDRTDAEKITFEHDLLNVDKTVSIDGYQMKLTTVGTKYDTVSIAWTSDSENCVIKDGVATFTVPDTGSVKVTLTAVFTCGEATQTFTYEITVEPMAATSIADVIAASATDGKVYKIVGWIVAANKTESEEGAFVIKDATGAIFSFNKATVKVGQKVIAYGTRAVNFGVAQFGTTKVVAITPDEGETFTEGEATEWAAADLDLSALSATTIANYTGKYYKITGSTYAIVNKYPQTQYNGKQLLSLYMNSGLSTEYTAFEGKEVVVYGWVRGFSTGNYLTIQVTKIEKVAEPEKTDADKVADAEKAIGTTLTISKAGETELYTSTEVTVTWAIKGETTLATLAGNKLTVAALPTDADGTFTLTATIKSGEVEKTVDVTVTVKKVVTTVNDGTVEKPYTVEEVVAVTANLAKDEYTESMIYVKGIVKSFEKGSYVKNLYLVDELGSTVRFLVYSANFTETVKEIAVGDTIVVKGAVKNYNGTIEMTNVKNGDTVVHDFPTLISCVAGQGTIAVAEGSSDKATVTIANDQKTGENYTTFVFEVTVTEGYELVSVKVDGVVVTAEGGKYTGRIAGNTLIFVETKVAGAQLPTLAATMTFDSNKTGRTSQTTQEQIWEQNGIKFTNSKGASTSDIIDSTNPVRLYKNSSVKIEFANIVKIVFKCSENKYVEALKASIGSTGSVTVSGKEVTVTFTEAVNEFSVVLSGGQVRLNSFDVYTLA